MDEKSPAKIEPDLAAAIVRGYVSHHQLSIAELSDLIAVVHRSLSQVGQPAALAESRTPAVPLKRSVQRAYVVCLECGLRGQTIRGHLRLRHGLTPAEYRARWSLPLDHPIVSPSYSERRAAIANSIGLRRGRKARAAPESAPAPKRRGRPRSTQRAGQMGAG